MEEEEKLDKQVKVEVLVHGLLSKQYNREISMDRILQSLRKLTITTKEVKQDSLEGEVLMHKAM
jgi:endonuclease III